jgi:tubulin-folding cofactor B
MNQITKLEMDHLKTIIKLNLTHSILTSMNIPEVRFSTNDPIIDVKMHLERRFGTKAGCMKLVLRNQTGENIAIMEDDYQTLGNYGAETDFTIHCIDEDANSILKQIDDLSYVEKYVMSDQDYDKLPMNVKKFKAKLKENNPELFQKNEINHKIVIDPDFQKDLAENIKKGDRCELIEEGHRGTVSYVGKVPDLGDGYFVGIELDEPWGNTDGSIQGVSFFETSEKYGVFRRPGEIQVGDFPELDIDEI